MRYAIVAALLLALGACGAPPAGTTSAPPEDASAGSTGVGDVQAEPFTMESEAVVGLWSFDRTCGLYDLVFGADANVEFYDYSNEGQVVSYAGTWEIPVNNRIALSLRRRDANNQPTGEQLAYVLDVASPVTDDLIGRFGRAGGSQARDITARRCPEEDRD